MLKVIELFAGIGAQREALKEANIDHEVIAISEIDKYAIEAYKLLHGDTFNLGDIKKIAKLPQADLWTYSFPCTDISLAGKLGGFEKGSNTSSSLLWEVQRLLSVSKENNELPKYLLLENVKNLVSKKFKPLFQIWLDYLTSLGYKNYWKVLNAKDYEIPQNRERVFCVSILCKESQEFVFPEKKELKLKLKDLLEDNVDEKYYLSPRMIKYIVSNNEKWSGNNKESLINKSIASTIATGEGSKRCDASNYVSRQFPEDFDLKKHLFIVEKYGNKTLDETLEQNEVEDGDFIDCFNRKIKKEIAGTIATRVSASNSTFIAQKYDNKPEYVVIVPQKTKDGYAVAEIGDRIYVNRCETKRGVVQKEKVPTIKSSCVDIGVVVPSLKGDAIAIRKLTPRECLRLMGWHDQDIDKLINANISNAQLYKLAGNSIVVNVLIGIFSQLFVNV